MECLQKRAGQYQELMDRETPPASGTSRSILAECSPNSQPRFCAQLNFLCEFGEGWVGLALPEFPGDFCDLSIFEGF
jgi:hypothetical protein